MGIKLKYISIMLKLIPLTSIKYNYTLYWYPSFLPLTVYNYVRRHFIGERKSRHKGQHCIKCLKHSEKYGDFRHRKRHAHIEKGGNTLIHICGIVTQPFRLLTYHH